MEYKFRGKNELNNKWVYGSYLHFYGYHISDIHHQIVTYDKSNIYEVILETVGQYTGLKDKNGKEIYEGDIVQIPLNIREYFNCEVKFNDGCFDVVQGDFRDYLKVYIANRCVKVIGNIYENPELLEVEK